MTEARQHLRLVARGASLSLLGSGVSAVATFGLVLVVARAFDPGTSGLFFAASALFLILVGFAGLGIDSGMARFGQRLEHEGRPDGVRVLFRTAGSTVTGIAVGLGALLLLVAGPVAQALDWGRGGADLLRLAGLALPLAVVAEYAQAGTRAFGRMHETVVIDRIGRSVAQVAGVAVAGAAGAGESGLMLAWLAWYPVAALWSLLALRRFLGDRVPSEPVDGLGPPGTPPGAAAARPRWAPCAGSSGGSPGRAASRCSPAWASRRATWCWSPPCSPPRTPRCTPPPPGSSPWARSRPPP